MSSRGQKIKNSAKIEHTRLFLFTLLVSFFMAFLAQKLIYTTNIWCNSVSGSFFGQDHLLIFFLSGNYYFRSLRERMAKMCTYFKTETDAAQNMEDFFF